MAIPTYYYASQIATYIVQVEAIFSLLKVKTGKQGEDGEEIFLDVPVQYGSKDRVAVAIMNDNTQNLPLRLPQMSVYWQDLRMAPERRKNVGQETPAVIVPRGGVLPDDVQVIHRYMPIPYNMTIELSIFSSNLYQRLQILEQILMLFDPDMQIQISDAPDDWTKISIMQLAGDITFEEPYPSGTDRRFIIDSMKFNVPIWLSPPVKFRQDFIKEAYVRMAGVAEIIHGGENAAHELLNEINDSGAMYELQATVEDLDVK